MASATLVHPSSSHTLSPLPKVSKTRASHSTYLISYSKNPNFSSLTVTPQLGLASFSTWNGLRSNGSSISLKSLKFEFKKKKCVGKGIFASLFGVGAPEALVIGVVALLVFGPKGLAEIAKNLGKTLRTFQPTIRELQEVSREFKSTLEKEIGLDELKNTTQLNTSNLPILSSAPLSVATPEKSPPETTTDSQATATPVAATTEDSQAALAAITEDSQATAPPLAAATEATTSPLAATTTMDPSKYPPP